MKKYLFILSLLFLLSYKTGYSIDSLIFIIRVDDIMNRNTTVLPRSIKPFEKVVNDRQGKISWAVIPHRIIEPENKNGNLVNELLSSIENGNEICQHGYNHLCPICKSYGHEMWCPTHQIPLGYAKQESIIVNGMKILQDSLRIKPTTFVPPGHSVDKTSFQVLVDYGFDIISTTGTTLTDLYPGLFNLAPHNDYTWALKPSDYQTKLRQALADTRTKAKTEGYFCLLLHDHFIRQGYENGLVIQWTAELLDSLIASYDDRLKFMTLQEAALYFISRKSDVALTPTVTPLQFSLYPNYPNPFNMVTIIRFQIPFAAHVSLTIYNTLGRKQVCLVNEFKSPGIHEAKFQSDHLSSGVYFYKLDVGEFSITRKMLYLP